HEHASRTGCVTRTCHLSVQQTLALMEFIVETRDVPGVGAVTATIAVQRRAGCRATFRRLCEARLKSGRIAAFRQILVIKQAFDAH
ncbi:hypothetical protein, partial [Leucobacter alluvii]|uniref:hypothetical protein n=1 Tax=Leucobacter alluvii TaxID=340321 RepID=UPI0031F77427